MAVDWTQFSATPPSASPQNVDWSQFTATPPGIDAGPPQASFQNVTAGVTESAQPVPLSQFDPESGLNPATAAAAGQAVRDFAGNVVSGVQGAVEDYQYPAEPGVRQVGAGEGFLRGLGSDIASIADLVSRGTPEGAAEHIAGILTGQPTYLEREAEVIGLHPNEQYTGARAEMLGELGHNLVSNFLPVERLASGASRLMRGAEDVVKGEALAGVHGPEAQGVAVADNLAGKPSGAMDITPEERVPAAEVPVPAPEPAPTPEPAPAPEATPAPAEEATVASDVTPEEQASFDRQQLHMKSVGEGTPGENNASGESAASVEAIGRAQTEPPRLLIDRDGTVQPLTGVDAVDTTARPGQVIVQRGIGDDPNGWTVLSHGQDIPPRLVAGRVNAARDALDQTAAEWTKPAMPETAPMEVPHAQDVRVDTGPSGIAGEGPAGGEVGGRGDLQRAGQEGGNAVPQRLREAGESPAPAPEPPTGPLGPTGIRNATVAAEREAMGWEAVKHDLSRTDPEGWARAEAKTAANPNYGRDLAASLAEKPRPISKEEVFALTQDRQRIRVERRQAYADAEQALASGDPEAAAQARARADRLDEEMERNDVAARVTGHETAEGLRARQRLAQEDYSMAALIQRAKVRKGGALTDAERTRIEGLARDIEAREAAVSAREQAVREAEARPRSPRVAQSARQTFDTLAEELKSLPRSVLCEIA